MMPLFDKQANELPQIAAEIECEEYGQLLTPLTRYTLADDLPFGVDNGAYSGFKAGAFLRLLERVEPHKDRCLFVAAPDIVGSARRTLEAFEFWQPQLAHWPLALVAQDGIEDLAIPWKQLRAIFIGGTDRFKTSTICEQVVRAAQVMGAWVHVGRVNNPTRWEKFAELGADSCDGSGISRFTHTRKAIAAGGLFTGAGECP